MNKLPIKISQSFMNESQVSQSDLESMKCQPAYCPRYLKFRYVDGGGKKVEPTVAMLNGSYFEWHLLGAVRDGVQPFLPRINIKDLRPKSSDKKEIMVNYIKSKQPEEDRSLLEALTVPALFALIDKMPPEMSNGDPSTKQIELDQIVLLAKKILSLKGLDVEKGSKQVKLETDEEEGHIDWITDDMEKLDQEAIYDVKYTETSVDDWRRGWGDPNDKEDAKTQAAHYTMLYYENTGKWVPFYFLVFGKGGWVKFIRMKLTETGLQVHKMNVAGTKELLETFVKSKWAARPEYNRCLECPFNDICDKRALLPEVQEVLI